MDVPAMMVPLKSQAVPIVARLPTCQKMLPALAPPVRMTLIPLPTVNPVPIWKDPDGIRVAAGVEG